MTSVPISLENVRLIWYNQNARTHGKKKDPLSLQSKSPCLLKVIYIYIYIYMNLQYFHIFSMFIKFKDGKKLIATSSINYLNLSFYCLKYCIKNEFID